MKELLTFLLLTSSCYAQQIHHGIKLNLNGTLDYVEWNETRYMCSRENAFDTIVLSNTYGDKYLICEEEVIANVLILVSPEMREQDRSDYFQSWNHDLFISDLTYLFMMDSTMVGDSVVWQFVPAQIEEPVRPFADEFDTVGVYDLAKAKRILSEFFFANMHQNLEWNRQYELEDTLTDYAYYEDRQPDLIGKLNRATFYDYNAKNQLIRVIGYDQRTGSVLRDSMVYDEAGNLIYLEKNHAGFDRSMYTFTYNTSNQVIAYQYRWVEFYPYDPAPAESVISYYEKFFRYNEQGQLIWIGQADDSLGFASFLEYL